MRFITPVELSEMTAIEAKTLVRLASAGKIPAVKVGGQWRFNREQIEHWLMTTASNARRRILAVDDDKEVLKTIGLILERRMGHEVLLAAGGSSAIDVLRDDKEISLIILDLKMEPISGVDILKWLKEQEREVAVLIITGYPDSKLLEEALKHEIFAVISKPFDDTRLIRAVNFALGGMQKLQTLRASTSLGQS